MNRITRYFSFLFLIVGLSNPMAYGAPAYPYRPDVPNPDMKAVLDELAALKGRAVEKLSPADARLQPGLADAVSALKKRRGLSLEPEAVAKVEDRLIQGPATLLPIRVYWPQGDGPHPVLVYFHGGGWVIGNLDAYDASARALTNAARVLVIAVHYRQAPEFKYPAAADDAFAAYQWVLANAGTLGGDPQRVAVAGESAGGNLAAVTSLRARDAGIAAPLHQLLIYPVTHYGFQTKSYLEQANAKPLNAAMMHWFWNHYLPSPAAGAEAYASPLQAKDLRNLPPATIVLADLDPLRSEGQAYGSALYNAGVNVRMANYKGVTHEFFGMGAVLPNAKHAVGYAAKGLMKSYGRP